MTIALRHSAMARPTSLLACPPGLAPTPLRRGRPPRGVASPAKLGPQSGSGAKAEETDEVRPPARAGQH
eukprot:9658025-Prorocentrum_lima.AAC.1